MPCGVNGSMRDDCCARSSNVERAGMKARGKLLVLGVSFALFVVGVAALYAMEGVAGKRTLAGVFAALVLVAGWQTVRLVKRRDGNK